MSNSFLSGTDGLTAFAGGGQASALLLQTQINRITTVASSGGSVLLPPAVSGSMVYAINHGANPMQVFGTGSDTINDVAAATGVSQPQSSVAVYVSPASGLWYSVGLGVGYGPGIQTVGSLDGITAAGANQAAATVLGSASAYNVTTTPSGTGVLLPPSTKGAVVAVSNQGANALLVYPNGTEKINALAASAGFSMATLTLSIFYCFTAGQWYTK